MGTKGSKKGRINDVIFILFAHLGDRASSKSLGSNLNNIHWIVVTLALHNWVLHSGVLPCLR